MNVMPTAVVAVECKISDVVPVVSGITANPSRMRQFVEHSIGIVTALVGVPVFVWLLRRPSAGISA